MNRQLALLSLVKVGCIVYVPAGESGIVPALVTAVRDGRVWARTERCPTKAERARGDYDRWTKTPRRYDLDQITGVSDI